MPAKNTNRSLAFLGKFNSSDISCLLFIPPQNKPDIILNKRESASRVIKSSIDVELRVEEFDKMLH